MTRRRYYAVLTGDIIESSRLRPSDLKTVRSSLVAAVDVVKSWKRGVVKGRLEFFRGDGWQLLLSDPAMALRVGVFLRASLLAGGLADSRIAIGLGEVETPSVVKLGLSTGQAFVLSGHALDAMNRYSRMTIEIPGTVRPLSDWMPVVGHLCDALVDEWTRRQAEMVCGAIQPGEPDYEKVAKCLKPPVSKQAVAKGLSGAKWYVIREVIQRFETSSWEAVLRPAE